jgi:hypothetical protein
MSPAVRDTSTIEWTLTVANAESIAKETQQDSRVVFITEGLPQEMNAANYGNATMFRPDVLTMHWIYRRHGSRNNWQWELRDIYLTGQRILRNGEAGKQQITNDYWVGRDTLPRFIEELAEKYRPDGDHAFTVNPEPQTGPRVQWGGRHRGHSNRAHGWLRGVTSHVLDTETDRIVAWLMPDPARLLGTRARLDHVLAGQPPHHRPADEHRQPAGEHPI